MERSLPELEWLEHRTGQVYTKDLLRPKKQPTCSGLSLQGEGFRLYIKGEGWSSPHPLSHTPLHSLQCFPISVLVLLI